MDESKSTSGTISIRLPQEMIDRIDARVKDVGLSRNAWAAKCFDWVLRYLPTGLAHPERDRVATDAPDDVTGTVRLPPAPHEHHWERKGDEKLCQGCGEIRNIPRPKHEAF